MPLRFWTSAITCLALALPATGAEPQEGGEGVHGGLSVGAGLAYDLAGLRAEIGSNHLGVFAGIGLLQSTQTDTLSADGGGSLSAGLRWYSGIRQGIFVSLNFTHSWWRDYLTFDTPITAATPTSPGRVFTATAVAGYRWRSRGIFAEVGFGGGMYRHKGAQTINNPQGQPRSPPPAYGPIPDVALGFGFDL